MGKGTGRRRLPAVAPPRARGPRPDQYPEFRAMQREHVLKALAEIRAGKPTRLHVMSETAVYWIREMDPRGPAQVIADDLWASDTRLVHMEHEPLTDADTESDIPGARPWSSGSTYVFVGRPCSPRCEDEEHGDIEEEIKDLITYDAEELDAPGAIVHCEILDRGTFLLLPQEERLLWMAVLDGLEIPRDAATGISDQDIRVS